MDSTICMNASCGVTTSNDAKNGWPLRSGGFARLCHNCGSAYESLVFCDKFHLEETGWRECGLCGRHIHCGCIASKSLFECLDYGGVGCITCMKGSQFHSIQRREIPNGFGALLTMQNIGDFQSSSVENRVNKESIGDENLLQLSKIAEANGNNLQSPTRRVDVSVSLGQSIRENFRTAFGEVGTHPSNVIQSSPNSSTYEKSDSTKFFTGVKHIEESLAHPSSTMAFGTPSALHTLMLPFSCGAVEGREQGKVPYPFQHSQRSRLLLPKPLKSSVTTSSEANKTMIRHMRIARPPAEGRGKNQLLPRYWPRITDQELEQLSGDLNSTIVPLFEKVLSASDAGRIGRLVLPKACAEAYFPPISQSEGLPIRIQDVKGNEWTFQFRFWPNNNSRMYVLEGVTPCIHSMKLQAGDTVIFSRIDPGGKLVMGFRKATNSVDLQDGQTPVLANGSNYGEPSFSSIVDNLLTEDGDCTLHKGENHGDSRNEDSLQQQIPVVEKKKARNIGPNNKRLLMHSEDALELRLTWEEAQDLLRPPPRANPSIVTIEDHDFEEYDEPPIFGKRTIFTAGSSKDQEQWAQCDDCSKWRRLPIDVLLPSKWTCLDNVWDSNRCSCSEPEEINPRELHNLLRVQKDYIKRRTVEKQKPSHEVEPSGLDALASAAVLGDYAGNLLEPAVGATTKHPRHRPGCTCIVCIQPPSGKGKHKSTCTCNVCLTVKRRFKTLMLRKKKRLSERKSDSNHDDRNGVCRDAPAHANDSDNEETRNRIRQEVAKNSNGKLDLNCDPDRNEVVMETGESSTVSVVQSECRPLNRIEEQSAVSGLEHVIEGQSAVPLSTGPGEGERGAPTTVASPAPPECNSDNTCPVKDSPGLE